MAATTGQKAVGSTAVSLGSQAVDNELMLTANPDNTGTIFIGPSGVTAGTGGFLCPGMVKTYTPDAYSNISACYAIMEEGKAGSLSWEAC